MIDALSRHSLEGGKRVILIENAERMTQQAQNCLLKTLEEAEEGTYFLLTCDKESALLPTIRSRCRVIRMQPWSRERIEKALTGRGIDASKAHALSLYCEGSLGRALQMQEESAYWQARDIVRRSFLSIQSMRDVPAAAQLLKDQRDSYTHIFTNNPKIGYFEIASKEGTICNSTIYKNNYWIGQERHIMDYKQENRIPPIREINYAIKRFDGIIERDVQSDTYNESSDIVTIRIGNTPFSGKYSRDYDKLRKKGINEETLNAIKSNISDVIPPYIVEILQKYSPEIANDIQLGDRIFHDY